MFGDDAAQKDEVTGPITVDNANKEYRLVDADKVKTLYFIRHAEGEHNVARRNFGRQAYLEEKYYDAPLTEEGRRQAKEARENALKASIKRNEFHLDNVELVVVSPLRRTIQSATILFEDYYKDKFTAMEGIRERYGVHPVDRRPDISDMRKEYANVDFSNIVHDKDLLWKRDVRETMQELHSRAVRFLNWIKNRKESEIAVVSHHDFLKALLNTVHVSQGDYSFKNMEVKNMRLILH